MTSAPADPVPEFVAAVTAGDVAKTRELLAAHPALTARIDDSLPGFHFAGTALLAAAAGKNRDLVDLLLQHGADINQKSRWWAGGFGVLDGDPDLVEFLIARGARVDVHAAARHGFMDRLRALVDADPSLVHARGGDGQTPLHAAKNVAVAEYLLSKGADSDALDMDHEGTPAQWMIKDRQDVVRYLLSRGAKPDVLMAAALGDIALVQKLLDEDPMRLRACVNADHFPMKDARAGGHIYIWSLGSNLTAHLVARQFGHDAVFDLLLDRSADPLKLAVLCRLKDENGIRALLTRQPDLAQDLDDAEQAMLVDAAMDDDAAQVRIMLEAGWRADARRKDNVTALHWAGFHGNAEMARALLAKGAPTDVKDVTYQGTPSGWTEHGSRSGWHPERGDYDAVRAALKAAGA